MSRTELDDCLDIAIATIEAAGYIALSYFRRPLTVTDKSGGDRFDPVTNADREVERFLRQELGSRFPDDGLVGEEEEPKAALNGRRWVIDPIDGTQAFISGVPAWGILLGLVIDEIPVAGIMHQPYLRETFIGTPQWGWFQRDLERIQLRASATTKLAQAILYSTDPAMFRTELEKRAFAQVSEACRMTRYGGDCYSYCLLALGHIDLVIDNGLKDFDILPLIPILGAAGAVVTDVHGAPVHRGGLVVAAATQQLSRTALALLQERPTSD